MINIISRYPSGKRRVTNILSDRFSDIEDFILREESNTQRSIEQLRVKPEQPDVEDIRYGVSYTLKGETLRRSRNFDTAEEQKDFILNIRFIAFDVDAYLIDPNC